MAIEANNAAFLVKHFLIGVKFGATACLGRQGLALRYSDLKRLGKARGLPESRLNIQLWSNTQADWFLTIFLEATKITLFDNSSYQQADSIHDLNEKIPNSMFSEFDAVIDGGTLEHILNFPVAVYNCMRLLKEGAFFLLCARKMEEIGLFSTSPQQSGYVRKWQGVNTTTMDKRKESMKRLLMRMPMVVQRLVRGHLEKYVICSIKNRNFYEPVERIL